MTARRWTAPFACVALLASTALTLPATVLGEQEQPVPVGPSGAPNLAAPSTNRLIVVWEPNVPSYARAAARDDADTAFVRTLGDVRFQLLRPQPGQSVGDALAALRDDPAVKLATRDTYDVLHATTDDPLLGQLWGFQNLALGINGFVGAIASDDADVLPAWDRTVGSPSIVIADIDSGYRFEHPDLASVVWTNPLDPANGADDDGNGIVDDTHGADFVGASDVSPTTDGDPTDDDLTEGGHGVHTAGTIGAAGNNGIGVSGVSRNVRIMPLRVCHPGCPASSQILAINYAGAHGARVANMSLGGLRSNSAISAAIAANPNVLFVISAGNGGTDGSGDDDDAIPTYPCSYALDGIICVAALDQADQLADFSNFGATAVDLGAPGVDVLSTFPEGPYVAEDFQAGDFATRWTATSGGGFQLSSESPLTSLGITDSPGQPPAASTTVSSTSPTVAIPAGTGDCTLTGSRTFSLGGGSLSTIVLRNGGIWRTFTPRASSAAGTFVASPITALAGTNMQIRFEYIAGGSPTASDGVWLDDVRLRCLQAVGQGNGYGFLDGTSMAAPHVTGAAGLLFSLKPSASVAEVKSAILSAAHPVAALAGKTVTGGRLDVAAALNALVPLTPPPPPPPPPLARPAVTCKVPSLKGLSLTRAKAKLRAAHCALGRVAKPRARRGRRLPPLVVRSSSPGAGARRAAGTTVKLTLAPKPRPRRHRRRRR